MTLKSACVTSKHRKKHYAFVCLHYFIFLLYPLCFFLLATVSTFFKKQLVSESDFYHACITENYVHFLFGSVFVFALCSRHVLELKNSDGSGDSLPLPSIGYLMLVTISIVFYEGKLPARMHKGIDLRFPYTLFWDKRTRPPDSCIIISYATTNIHYFHSTTVFEKLEVKLWLS